MNFHTLWPLAQEALQALGSRYYPAMEQAAAEFGLKSPEWQGWLLPALTFEPDPISVEKLRIRSPYTSPSFTRSG